MFRRLVASTFAAAALALGSTTAATATDVFLEPITPWDPRPDIVVRVSPTGFLVANVGSKWSTGAFVVHVSGKWGSLTTQSNYVAPSLAPGQSAMWLLPPSLCSVVVRADSTLVVAESNETNNAGYGLPC